MIIRKCRVQVKVSVQGVVALGGHFATLCQVDFYEAIFFIINFQIEKANTFTLLIIHDPQSARINV